MNGYERARPWDIREEFWIWRHGIPEPIWVTHLDIIESTISELDLTPLDIEDYPGTVLGQQVVMTGAQFAQVAAQTEDLKGKKKRPIFPGGLRCPHLHFKKDIYILNDDQWKTFSKKVIDGFKNKLSKVGTVSFEQLLETSDAITTLA